MRGIRINFGEAGPRFDFSETVRAFDATVQNALVNVGTDLGSDMVFLDRGTNLKIDGAQGRMSTKIWANHSAGFAALRTLSFSQQNDQTTNAWKLQAFTLQCLTLVNTTAVLNVQAVSEGGTVVGGLANI